MSNLERALELWEQVRRNWKPQPSLLKRYSDLLGQQAKHQKAKAIEEELQRIDQRLYRIAEKAKKLYQAFMEVWNLLSIQDKNEFLRLTGEDDTFPDSMPGSGIIILSIRNNKRK